MTATTKNQRTLNKLGAGWTEEPEGTFRFDCDETVFLRVRHFPQERTWTCVRFEIRAGVPCATNGLHFPSLKQLAEELNRQRESAD